MRYLFFAIATLIVSPALAKDFEGQAGKRVVGVVVDRHGGATLENAKVWIQEAKEDHQDTTNERGIFYILIPSGMESYVVHAEATGYLRTYTKDYENSQDPRKITIKMETVPPRGNALVVVKRLPRETEIEREVARENIRRIVDALWPFGDTNGDPLFEEINSIFITLGGRPGSLEQPTDDDDEGQNNGEPNEPGPSTQKKPTKPTTLPSTQEKPTKPTTLPSTQPRVRTKEDSKPKGSKDEPSSGSSSPRRANSRG